MKIVKWTKYDLEALKAAGIEPIEGTGRATEMERKVVDEIIEKKYKFDGTYHQNGDHGIPVAEIDGKLYYLMESMRAWGATMAEAWCVIDRNDGYDYIDFYCTRPEGEKLPEA